MTAVLRCDLQERKHQTAETISWNGHLHVIEKAYVNAPEFNKNVKYDALTWNSNFLMIR